MSRRRTLRLAFLCSLIFALSAPSQADTMAFAWDALADPRVSGYRLYYGTSSGSYTLTQDVDLSQQTVLSDLSSCTDYYVSIKAVAADGTESQMFADEISGWARPVVSTAIPQFLRRGTTLDVVIGGANYRDGVVVTVSNPGITVHGVSVQGCNQLTANLSIGPDAALGPFDVVVADAVGIFGMGTVANVTVDPNPDTTAPVIEDLQAGSVGSTTATISWITDEPSTTRSSYRKAGETAYRQTALELDLETSHSVTLVGLSPETAYEYSVESMDANGNSATMDGLSVFTTTSSLFTYLRFEPENRPLASPAEVQFGSDAFGGGWIQLAQGTTSGTPGSPSGSWDYGFSLPSGGTWNVWLRMYAPGGSAREWYETVDGGSFAVAVPAQTAVWEWVAARSWTLPSGQHTLTLGGAQAGARIDRVLLTDDLGFLPTEQPGSDITPPPAPASASVEGQDQQVVLGWTNPSSADLDRIVLRYRADGVAPTSPIDGQGVIDRPAAGGVMDGTTHSGLVNGVTLSYALFAIDAAGNVSPPVFFEATPGVAQDPLPGQVQNVHRNDTVF